MKTRSNDSEELSFFYFHSLWDFSVFKGKLAHIPLLVYNGVLILLVTLFNTFLNNSGTQFNSTQTFLYSFFGIPILAFFIYGLFYVVLNAFLDKRKAFFESFLVFLAISMPFVLIGHILDWIRSFISGTLDLLLTIGIIVFLIYYLVNFVLHFRIYYKASAFKIVTSFFLVDMFFLFLAVIQYLSYLLSNIK